MQDRVRQINVGGRLTGIIGLDEAMTRISKPNGADRETVISEIISNLAKKNYIPDKLMTDYRAAIGREYKMYLGEAVEEEESGDLRVVILGAGCYQCSSLENLIRNVMAEMNLAGEIIHVTDAREIGRYGVMGAPALVINQKVVSVGVVPEKKKVQGWLDDAVKSRGVR